MTCVVAIEHEGKVWMGGDSAATREDDIVCRSNEKVFINGEFIIGYSGSFRIGQLLQYALKPPKQNLFKQTDMEYMVIDFVDALRKMLKEKGALMEEKEGDAHDSEFIVGYQGKIYVIESDFNVSRPLYNYAACGVGMDYALGAMFVMPEELHVVSKIEKALLASSEFCTAVRKPFNILSL